MTALRVTTAAESAARDQAAIAAGVPSFDLMRNAGSASAALILREYSDRLAHGVALYVGSGNNGGDAYIVAAQLARAGVSVRMQITAAPRTADALRAKSIADSYGAYGAPTGHERVVVDGLLGTGHRGALRDGIAAACARMAVARHAGATMVALDLPSGLDASTGEIADGSVAAHDTLCFGTIKRGVLLARAHAGRVVLLDIGLPHEDEGDERDDGAVGDEGAHGDDHAWRLASAGALARWVPPVAWDAHKGRRGRVIVVGGQEGMAGAVVLASRGALAAGAGVVHALVEAPSVAAVQGQVPQAIAESWSARDTLRRCHAMAIGPGLGRDGSSALLLRELFTALEGQAVVLDADALWLTAMAAREDGMDAASWLRRWMSATSTVVCTPHVGEFAQLLGHDVPLAWDARVDAVRAFAVRAGVTMLLKGTPSVVVAPQGRDTMVVPYGTPLLATGGSGDLLTGFLVALMGQGMPPVRAAICAATVHGRAAELATARLGGVRGGTLEQLLQAVPEAWRTVERPERLPPNVLAYLVAPQ